MATLVIKSWSCNTSAPDSEGAYVRIIARSGGVFAWLLSLAGIDPTYAMSVSKNKITYETGSLSGKTKKVIPLTKVSSASYGYAKPWKQALLFFAALTAMAWSANALADSSGAELGIGVQAAAVLAVFALPLLYYALNKTLTLGVIEDAGPVSQLQFKRSVIENQKIDEGQAAEVALVIQTLVDWTHRPRTPRANSSKPSAQPAAAAVDDKQTQAHA